MKPDYCNTAHFLDLPHELVEVVAKLLIDSTPALLELRSTYRQLCSITQDLVTEHYFKDGVFLLENEESMQVLLEISRHPL